MRIKNWKRFQHFRNRRPPWIKLYRDLLDDPDWHGLDIKASKVLVMLWLVASEYDGELPKLEKLAFRLRMEKDSLETAISKLGHWIDITPISEGYQDATPEGEGEGEREGEKEGETTLSSRLDVIPPKPEYLSQAKEVLQFLNAKTGKNFRPVKANLDMIVARLKEGATVTECRAVIVRKCREWGTDEKMAKYLRPGTLFNATKFAQYSGEVGSNHG